MIQMILKNNSHTVLRQLIFNIYVLELNFPIQQYVHRKTYHISLHREWFIKKLNLLINCDNCMLLFPRYKLNENILLEKIQTTVILPLSQTEPFKFRLHISHFLQKCKKGEPSGKDLPYDI